MRTFDGPAIGLGTWYLGDDPATAETEIEALRRGLDLGIRVIDTAEMYGSGRSESLIGRAIAGRRDEVTLVTKVLPHHADRAGVAAAARASLERLGTDHVDVYLLHWRGSQPLAAGGQEVEVPGSLDDVILRRPRKSPADGFGIEGAGQDLVLAGAP